MRNGYYCSYGRESLRVENEVSIMSNERTAKRKIVKKVSPRTSLTTKEARQAASAAIDNQVKATAGQVQEELTPIRHAAGHSHTH